MGADEGSAEMAVITISRQYGSGGGETARRVCELLGYRLFDKRLLAALASAMGLLGGKVVDLNEYEHEVPSFLEQLLPRRVPVAEATTIEPGSGGATTTVELDEAEMLDVVRGAIRAAAKLGDVVILGRGGQVILAGEPGVLHARLVAPLDDRVRRVAEREHIDEATAREIWVFHEDEVRADYVRRSHGVEAVDPLLYHLVINTSLWGTEAAAQLIARAVADLPTPAV
jgi:cytidylate kinase